MAFTTVAEITFDKSATSDTKQKNYQRQKVRKYSQW